MCTIKALAKKCGSNYNPILHFYLAVKSDISAIADPVTSGSDYRTVTTDITMVATKTFKKVELARGSGKFVEVLNGTADTTTSVKSTATGFYPEADAQASEAVNGMIGVESILLVEYSNGDVRLVGTLKNPVVISKFDEDSQKGGYDIEMMWEGSEKSPFYTGTIAV
jgi:hypothetical protein